MLKGEKLQTIFLLSSHAYCGDYASRFDRENWYTGGILPSGAAR